MTTLMSHRNHQSYDAGRFVRDARRRMSPRREAERKVERLVFAMVACLSGLAFWTAADTLPSVMVAHGTEIVPSALDVQDLASDTRSARGVAG